MTKSKSTKRALVSSTLAILMCMAMLIGTTFAWFTDTASTAVNKIQSGKLDVDLEMATAWDNDGNPTKWETADGKKLTFKTVDKREAEKILWEPGCTYELPELRVVNKGNLALKYKVTINGVDGDAKLLEAIDFTVKKGGEETSLDGWEGYLLPAGATPNDSDTEEVEITKAITISGHMKEEAGNEYQDKTIEGIGITVVATQYTYEYDSDKNTYDEDAEYPVIANTQQALDTAITDTATDVKTTVALPAGTFNLTDGKAKDKDITIMGSTDTVIDICQNLNGESGVNSGMNYQDGANLAFEGVTILGQTSGNYGGIVRATTTYKDCTIKGKLTLYGNATFINCKFENLADYAIWTWGAEKVEFIGCTFNSGGKALLVYGEDMTTNVLVDNCIFTDNGSIDGKAAIETGVDPGRINNFNIVINNITVNGFDINSSGINTNSTLWANKNSMDKDHLNVVIDGVDVY